MLMLHLFGKMYATLFGENPNIESMHYLDWIIYLAFTMLLNIVSLNLLISIISNTFDKVQESMNAYHCKTKAELLLELGSFSREV